MEATASVGGQLLPPIMGAAAFVMAETLGVQYPVIIKAAVLPALIYYLGIILQVQMRATKDHLHGIPKDQLPRIGQVMRERGHLLIPIIFLLYMLIWSGKTVIVAAFWTIIVTIVVAQLRPISRMSVKDLCDAFVAGAKSTRVCFHMKSKHRLTMVNTPLNKALGVRNQIFHSNDTRSAVAWTWERMMSATCRRSSKSMLSQFPRWEDRYSIFCGETLSAFSAAISFISP